MNRYIGIDPGSKGCVAVIDDNDRVLSVTDLDKDYYTYWWHIQYLLDVVNEDEGDVYVAVEDVCGRPRQSCAANTTFMKLAGMAELVGYSLGAFSKVKPQIWKKHFGLIFDKTMTKTQKKHESIRLAKEFFPSVADSLTASKDGRAEALLIARYCKDVQCK